MIALESLSPSQKLEALALLESKARQQARLDPVVFAQYYLDFNPDPWQENFLRSRAQRIILNCSRQSGKSTTTAILALWEAIHKPKSTIVLDSPSLRQSQELMLKFSEFLCLVDQNVKIDSDTKLSVKFANGSRVLALPGSEKTIRGISAVTLLVIDEAAAVPDELYGAVRPMLAVSNGRLVLMSTPRGEQGFFYETWAKSQGWEKVEVPWRECPRISPEFLEEERREQGNAWVSQEYECQFVAAGATRVRREWLKYVDQPPQGLKIAVGVDLAISEKATADYTACAALGRDNDGTIYILDVDRIRTSFADQLKFIRSFADKWRPTILAIEDVMYQRAMVQQVSAATTYNVRGLKPDRDKVARFAPLEARYEQGQVKHVRGLPAYFEGELLSFPISQHDDIIDAMSLAFTALGMIQTTTKLTFAGATKTPAWKRSS